ncbi:MAG: glycosyltransferase family 2 protein, partial [Planctomycetia bacterium]
MNGVTIVVPNWNHESFLSRSVGSALKAVESMRAAGGDGEVVVVDDESTDGSATLLRQMEALYCDAGLRVLILKRNKGVGHARNLGMREASYPFVLMLDADNELSPDAV